MLTFDLFQNVPDLILWSCIGLLGLTLCSGGYLWLAAHRISKEIRELLSVFGELDGAGVDVNRRGLDLATMDSLRQRCESLVGAPKRWWEQVESHIESYTSPEEIEGSFLTCHVRDALPYETVVGQRFNAGLFGAIPGLLTGAGLTLTFVAILLALHDVSYDKANTVEPVRGIENLINGLSGKFLSSIVALLLSILFTLAEKRAVRRLRLQYETLVSKIRVAIPFLSSPRILLDIQRFAAKQTVSVSNISAEVVDRFVAGFNQKVVPDLAASMSSGVADRMQAEFRPTMDRMTNTLQDLQTAIVGLERNKQESVTG